MGDWAILVQQKNPRPPAARLPSPWINARQESLSQISWNQCESEAVAFMQVLAETRSVVADWVHPTALAPGLAQAVFPGRLFRAKLCACLHIRTCYVPVPKGPYLTRLGTL